MGQGFQAAWKSKSFWTAKEQNIPNVTKRWTKGSRPLGGREETALLVALYGLQMKEKVSSSSRRHGRKVS